MNAEKTIKLQAKAKLRNNNWAGVAGGATLLGVVVMTAIYLAELIDLGVVTLLKHLNVTTKYMDIELTELHIPTYLLYFLFAVLIIPMFVGYLRYIYFITKDGKADFSGIFYYSGKMYFKGLGTGLGFIFRNFWKLVISFVPFLIASYIVSAATAEKFQNYETLAIWDVLCYILVYALLFGGIILFARLSAGNFLYFYLHFEDENLRPRQLCKLSQTYMQNFTDNVFRLFMSVFPLILSCIFVIPALFVLPYAATVMSTSAKWLVAMHHKTTTETTDEPATEFADEAADELVTEAADDIETENETENEEEN